MPACDARLTFVRLVHKLKEFVHDRLQELPVCLEEARVLANNVHDIGGNNGFVVLPSFYFNQAQEFFDDSHEEPFFSVLV